MVDAAALVSQVRAARQLSMNALADLSGVSVSTISRIEAGKTEPSVGVLSRLSQAAGFRFDPLLEEAGSDQPFADALDQLGAAEPESRGRWFGRLSSVARVSPVAKRLGARRAALTEDLATAVAKLDAQGRNPVVSGMEAVAGTVIPTRSFIPLVYVDDPGRAEGFDEPGTTAFQAMLLMPTTANVVRYSRSDTKVPMVTWEWGLLDAMASPGRQSDIAHEFFDSLRSVV
jgi:transcriptional regulator with XRE-family HTH domain